MRKINRGILFHRNLDRNPVRNATLGSSSLQFNLENHFVLFCFFGLLSLLS